jgi:metal-responsive CopG/Arc/MetJ family transcriptional regulator
MKKVLMTVARIAVALDEDLLNQVDRIVEGLNEIIGQAVAGVTAEPQGENR